MSITIKSTPDSYSSAHEPLWFVVESTNKAISGFQYVFDVYKNGELITRQRNSPYGTDKYGVINLSSIVRSYLDTPALGDFDPTNFASSYTMGADVFFTQVDVRFGEICGTTTTVNSASGTYTAYNNYKRNKYEGADSVLSSGVYFMTNRPYQSTAYEGEPVVLTARFNNGTNYVRRLQNAALVDVSGVNITGSNQAVTYGFLPENGGGTYIYDSTVMDVRDSRYFTVKCSKYQARTLIFLNAFGGWDSFTFVNGNLSNENDKKKFERNNWELSGFNMVENNGRVYNEGVKVYANRVKTKMKLTSDILNTDEYIWLSELINSPCVYLYDSDNNEFLPVTVANTNYDIKNALQNKAESLEIDIEFSNKKNTQFR